MAVISGESTGAGTGIIILRLGRAIGLFLLVLIIMPVFMNYKTGIRFDNFTIGWIIFWSGWCLVCYVMELRLATGTWCLKPPRDAGVPKLTLSRKTWGYFSVSAIFSCAFIGVGLLQMNGWGGHDLMLPLIGVQAGIIFLSAIFLFLFWFSFEDDKAKYKALLALDAPPDDQIPSTRDDDVIMAEPVEDSQPLNFSGILIGLLRAPRPTMRYLRDVDFTPACRYFLGIAGIFLIPVCILAGIMYLIHPENPLSLIGFIFFLAAGCWLVFVSTATIMIRLFGKPHQFRQTLVTGFYAVTPLALFWWIPLIGTFTVFWVIYLMKCGLEERQDVPETAALIAAAVSAGITFIVGILLVFIWIFWPMILSGYFL
jgi:Yip1 domain